MNVAGILDSKILDYFDYTFIGLNGLLDSIFYAQNSIVGRTTIKEDLKILLRMWNRNDNYSKYD